ncbi:uncharacterized protein B0T23DRAFT_316304 [Neurospora hispaniola]|uniref:Uncharacterized protein n=1 Tax=Neurospora hispaniola TaxID=588809 RepID=A0AAJ0I727_9PEZI|nr:hypothetical protein B0T23DRAFT_316304 [Neurospora hispaniola]
MEQEAFELSRDIDEQKEKIRRLQSNFGDHANYALRFYAAHRWKNIRKPKLELLQPRMAQLKSTLQLIIAVIQLEVLSRNGSATRGESRLNEMWPGMTGGGDAATGICFLAYNMALTGRVPRTGQEIPVELDFAQLTTSRIMNIDPRHWAPPPDSLPANAPICPHCYRDTRAENGHPPDGTSWNRNKSIPNITNHRSRHRERPLPPLPPPESLESLDRQEPTASRPQYRAPSPPPHPHIPPLFHPNPPLVEIREQPSGSELHHVPADDDSTTQPGSENQYLREPPLYRPRSRSPRPRQPTTVEQVLVWHNNGAWVPQFVRFDPNLDIRNRHGANGAEIPYGGLISEDYVDSLSLTESVEWYRREFVFPYDDEHRAVRGIGTVDIEWKKQPGLDDWDELVVERPRVKCIVCREMPCEEELVLKLHD